MIDANEYAYRRNRVLEKLPDGSISLFFAGVGVKCSADENFDFVVNKNFYYLTGIEQDNSVLMLVKADGETNSYLFIDEKDEKVEKWLGIKLTTEEARDISGIDNVLIRTSFDGKLSAALSSDMTYFGKIDTIFLDLEKDLKIGDSQFTTDLKDKLSSAYPQLKVEDNHKIVMKLRMIKSQAEIDMIREAISTTDVALKNVLKELRPGMFEYNLRNIFEFTVREDVNAGIAFHSIVAGGINATILHYPHAKELLNDGELVLLDVGAAKSYYCADISRTYPISGKFSALQRKIYQIVLDCNKQTAKFIRPGINLKEVQMFAQNYLAEECAAQGLIPSKDRIRDVYYHSVSHHLGLDTHDSEERDSMLEPGMIITCEPGLYFKEFGIGVRIEDDILITDNGSECLSKDVIKEIEDIERILISK